MQPHPTEFVDAHLQMQVGTYFTSITLIDSGLRYAYSQRIKDYYWNFGCVTIPNLRIEKNHIPEIRDVAAKYGRDAAILVIGSDDRTRELLDDIQAEPLSSEAWMVFDPSLATLSYSAQSQFEISRSNYPDNGFLKVFRDAYGTQDIEGGIGYSDLPDYYPESLEKGSVNNNVKCWHFTVLSSDGAPAAIASVYIFEKFACLYNVGTIHKNRGKGYGTAVSMAALKHALSIGCSSIFLQTGADGPVERMYCKLGFQRYFIGTLYSIEERS